MKLSSIRGLCMEVDVVRQSHCLHFLPGAAELRSTDQQVRNAVLVLDRVEVIPQQAHDWIEVERACMGDDEEDDQEHVSTSQPVACESHLFGR